jgi:hypothetical protein
MALSTRVGFPDVWKDYRGLEIKRTIWPAT